MVENSKKAVSHIIPKGLETFWLSPDGLAKLNALMNPSKWMVPWSANIITKIQRILQRLLGELQDVLYRFYEMLGIK